jgi:hypothetical protein
MNATSCVERQVFLIACQIVGNFANGALAHLQRAGVQPMTSDKIAARQSYEEFRTLWKDAGPTFPLPASHSRVREARA